MHMSGQAANRIVQLHTNVEIAQSHWTRTMLVAWCIKRRKMSELWLACIQFALMKSSQSSTLSTAVHGKLIHLLHKQGLNDQRIFIIDYTISPQIDYLDLQSLKFSKNLAFFFGTSKSGHMAGHHSVTTNQCKIFTSHCSATTKLVHDDDTLVTIKSCSQQLQL